MIKLSIEDIADKSRKFSVVDGPFGTQLHADEYTTEGVPVIRIVNLSYSGKFQSYDLVFISEEKCRELIHSEVIKDDIIIGKTGATIGKSGKYPYDKGIIASSCLKVTPDKKKVNPNYLLYLITTKEGQNKIIDGAGGSTRTTINNGPFKKIHFDFPVKPIQDKIVDYLSTVDQSIEQSESLIAKYSALKPD